VAAGVSLAAIVVLGPVPAVLAAAAAALARVELVRRARQRRQRASDGVFPDLVDLFRIAAAAGHPVHRCLEVVAARAPAPLRAPLTLAVSRVQRGVPLADVLHSLGPELGTAGPVLTDALRAALRTGAPLGPVLDRVGLVARDRRTRSAQAAARRLPVTMLFPLVCCVLPAFGLLGVVPLLAGSLDSLAP
jgi:tight adherence protein C